MDAKDLIEFVEEVGRLKLIPRIGWRFHGINSTESVADHSYRVALLAMLLGDMLKECGVLLDTERLLRIAILHEIPEAKISDVPFPAFQFLSEEIKEKAEKEAVREMVSRLGRIGEKYEDLWTEFEDRESLEAKVVRAADKLELMMQVYEYEKIGYRNLDRFWNNPWNRRDFDVHPLVGRIMEKLEEMRGEIFKIERGEMKNAREDRDNERRRHEKGSDENRK